MYPDQMSGVRFTLYPTLVV